MQAGIIHKHWLENEYEQWESALASCSVDNFKEHPMVTRMLSEPDKDLWDFVMKTIDLTVDDIALIREINQIGYTYHHAIDARCVRYVYYADIIRKMNPDSIVEIGGGCGQFYATLRAMGYTGQYKIMDRIKVKEFQRRYLSWVSKRTGINTQQSATEFDLVVSFYALGEFDDNTKHSYFANVINTTPHGFVAWNAHSGSSDDTSLFTQRVTITDGIEPGIKIIQW